MTQPISDPYAVLGVPRDASQRQVRQAYRRLALRYHPDLDPDEQASERMRRINEAWRMLSSPLRRRRYDANDPRRSTAAVTSHRKWEGSWASTHQSDDYRRTSGWDGGVPAEPRRAAPRESDLGREGRPRVPTLLVAVAVAWLLFGTIFVGFLPPLLFVIVLWSAARWIFSRTD